MKYLQKLVALTVIMSTLVTPAIYSQPEECCYQESPAYEDSGYASNMTALLPVGVLVVAGILIATSSHHDHSHHRRGGSSSSHAHVE